MAARAGTTSRQGGRMADSVAKAPGRVASSSGTPPWNIGLMAVGNLKSKTVLSTFYGRLTSKEKDALTPLFPRFLEGAPASAAALRRKFPVDGGGLMFLAGDPTGSFLLGVYMQNKQYPERVAFGLLTEFQELVLKAVQTQPGCGSRPGLLEKVLRQSVRSLMSKYEQASNVDKTTQVINKVEDVKIEIEKSVQKVLQNQENLGDLECRTSDLAGRANTFKQAAGDVKRVMWWQKTRITIVLGLVILSVLAYLIFVLIDFLNE
ncbi:synaptobrevin protein [Cystoisospora suis]|uniref:Synaptobrevin protein n=1 Tax=Cystoisospora suis TaxID=483139 RepID=A0A2C6KI87_9APIC|nr:synaptobrevin protein [Cystoisospora suis]